MFVFLNSPVYFFFKVDRKGNIMLKDNVFLLMDKKIAKKDLFLCTISRAAHSSLLLQQMSPDDTYSSDTQKKDKH